MDADRAVGARSRISTVAVGSEGQLRELRRNHPEVGLEDLGVRIAVDREVGGRFEEDESAIARELGSPAVRRPEGELLDEPRLHVLDVQLLRAIHAVVSGHVAARLEDHDVAGWTDRCAGRDLWGNQLQPSRRRTVLCSTWAGIRPAAELLQSLDVCAVEVLAGRESIAIEIASGRKHDIAPGRRQPWIEALPDAEGDLFENDLVRFRETHFPRREDLAADATIAEVIGGGFEGENLGSGGGRRIVAALVAERELVQGTLLPTDAFGRIEGEDLGHRVAVVQEIGVGVEDEEGRSARETDRTHRLRRPVGHLRDQRTLVVQGVARRSDENGEQGDQCSEEPLCQSVHDVSFPLGVVRHNPVPHCMLV